MTHNFWNLKEVRPYILKFLKNKFPKSIIVRELDHVDIMILGPNIPVEIQRSRKNFSQFENEIRKQIEQNISIYGKCWFFFDNNVLKHLNNLSISSNTSLNMDWLYQFFKSSSLQVFTINSKKRIRKLTDADFSFIFKISQTCKLNNSEEKILQKRRTKIMFKILRKEKFSSSEINIWYNLFENDNGKGKISFTEWSRKRDERQNKLSNIFASTTLQNLIKINDMLNFNMKDRHGITFSSIIGIIEGNGHHKHRRINCIDKYNILKYFPGYLKHKNAWNYLKLNNIDQETFTKIVNGKYNFKALEKLTYE